MALEHQNEINFDQNPFIKRVRRFTESFRKKAQQDNYLPNYYSQNQKNFNTNDFVVIFIF